MKERILKLTLKKEWFDLIKSGHKKQEFRELKKHWISRFCGNGSRSNLDMSDLYEFVPREFNIIEFKNGYSKNAPTFKIVCLGIELSRNIETPLGKGDFFVINLGKLIN